MYNRDFEKKLCESLIQIKKQDSRLYNYVLNVLEFIYKDIKMSCFKTEEDLLNIQGKIDSINSWNKTYDNIHQMKEFNDDLFAGIVENESGIVAGLIEICQNPDSRFATKFFESIEVPIDILRRNITPNTKDYFYLMNIYAILYADHVNKDNYENFAAIVDDLTHTFIPAHLCERIKPINNIKRKRDVISSIVTIKDYQNLPDIRSFIKTMFHNMADKSNTDDYSRLNPMFAMYQDFYRNLANLNRKNTKVSPELEQEIVSDISLLVHDDLLPGVYPYYSRIMLYNNRYQAFKEQIKAVNPYYRKEVFDTIKTLNIGLFADLNHDQKEDSFITCMNHLFDSDTYRELLNKLNVLKLTSQTYTRGNKESAFNEINYFFSDQNKERFDDIVIAYPSHNSLNKISKPKTIDQRMSALYQEYNLVRPSFDLTERKENLEKLTQDIYQEMLNYQVIKFASKQPVGEPAPVKKKSIFSNINPKR